AASGAATTAKRVGVSSMPTSADSRRFVFPVHRARLIRGRFAFRVCCLDRRDGLFAPLVARALIDELDARRVRDPAIVADEEFSLAIDHWFRWWVYPGFFVRAMHRAAEQHESR